MQQGDGVGKGSRRHRKWWRGFRDGEKESTKVGENERGADGRLREAGKVV